jgi:putative chitobiose transport system permease protein
MEYYSGGSMSLLKSNKGFLFVFPALIFLLLFAFIPFVRIVIYSFMDYNLMNDGNFIGISNYSRLFQDHVFWMTLLNSFLFILATPVIIIISLTLALFLRDASARNSFLRSIYFFPVITPVVIAGIIWRWILSEDYGIMNYLLSLLGMENVQWLTLYPVNLFSVMLLTVWRGFGYYMMIFLAGLMIIPKELEESALLDGAGPLRRVIDIIIPQLKPVIIFVFVISSSAAIKIFTEIYILIPGTPMGNKSIVSFLFREAFERFEFGLSSAAGVILFLISLGFAFMNIRFLEKKWDT